MSDTNQAKISETIPAANVIRSRLTEAVREVNFLRSLLRLVERREAVRRPRNPRGPHVA